VAIFDLKDLSQTLEIARRTRRELPEGETRDAVDQQILRMMGQINSIIGEDERLAATRRAEEALLRTMPQGVNWDLIKITGAFAKAIALVAGGTQAEVVWKTHLLNR
jgi:hypothetical protein